MKRRIALVIALLLCAALPCAAEDYVRCTAGTSVHLRSGPGTEYAVVGSLQRGALVRQIDAIGDWRLIFDGFLQAWVSARYTEPAPTVDWLEAGYIRDALDAAECAPAMGSATCIAAEGAAARSAPDANSAPAGVLEPNTPYPLYERREGFLRVRTDSGDVWVDATLMEARLCERLTLDEGFSFRPIEGDVQQRINGRSYGANCTVPYSDLRYLSILYCNFEGDVHPGEIICNASVAREMLIIFRVLYEVRYPLTMVRLVDDFDAVDRASMSANNTSCFNFRLIAGTDRLSNHALGLAIDVNPQINPYVSGSYVSPANGAAYADRLQDFEGRIDAGDLCYQLFARYGWQWGGAWQGAQDYQHFEKYL